MVGPDTLACRLTGQAHEVDSVGALYKNIQTSILLCSSVLKTDNTDIVDLRKKIAYINAKTTKELDGIGIEYS